MLDLQDNIYYIIDLGRCYDDNDDTMSIMITVKMTMTLRVAFVCLSNRDNIENLFCCIPNFSVSPGPRPPASHPCGPGRTVLAVVEVVSRLHLQEIISIVISIVIFRLADVLSGWTFCQEDVLSGPL